MHGLLKSLEKKYINSKIENNAKHYLHRYYTVIGFSI